MSKSIDVTDLPDPLVAAIEAMVRTYREKAVQRPATPPGPRPIGWLRGEWALPTTFFEPLPDELLDLFEGKEGGRP